jgi:hypothetical protein
MMLSFVTALRVVLDAHRRGLRELLAFAGAAFATLAGAFLLVSFSFEAGHVAASFLGAVVGALLLSAAARIRSNALAAASYAWLVVILIEAWGYDVPQFDNDVTSFSPGGWSLLAASAALVLAAYTHRVLDPERRGRDWLLGSVGVVGAIAATFGLALLVPDGGRLGGVGMLVIALSYLGLAAGVFVRAGFRNAATILWSLGLVLLVGAEALLVDHEIATAVVLAATALSVAALARPLHEMRLWLAGGALALATTATVALVQAPAWLPHEEIGRRFALSSAACALALLGVAALVWGESRWRDLATCSWAAGTLAVLATERILLDDWRATAFGAALTGALLGLLAAKPLREPRLWSGGVVVVAAATVSVMGLLTPPSHLLAASAAPADGLCASACCLMPHT